MPSSDAPQLISAAIKEHVDNEESCSLVSVYETVIACKRFCQCCCFRMNPVVVASKWPAYGSFERGLVPHSRCATTGFRPQCAFVGLKYIAQCDLVVADGLSLCKSPKGGSCSNRRFVHPRCRPRARQWYSLALSRCGALFGLAYRDKLPRFRVTPGYAGLRARATFRHDAIIGVRKLGSPRRVIGLSRMSCEGGLVPLLVGSACITESGQRNALALRNCWAALRFGHGNKTAWPAIAFADPALRLFLFTHCGTPISRAQCASSHAQ